MVDLERRVRDPESLRDGSLDVASKGMAVLALTDEDVGRERVEPRGDAPDMEVVHARDARDVHDRAGYGVRAVNSAVAIAATPSPR